MLSVPAIPEVSSYLDASEFLTELVLSDSGPISLESKLLFLYQKDGADTGNKRCLAHSNNPLSLETYRLSILSERKKYQASAAYLKKKEKGVKK